MVLGEIEISEGKNEKSEKEKKPGKQYLKTKMS
jgi:hypothetical protein